MKRGNFIFLLLASVPMASFAKMGIGFSGNGKGFKVNTGESRYHGHLKLKGVNANVLDVKVSGRDTNGALAIFEQTSLSPNRGTPMHIHLTQDEIFYVLKGEYYFQVGSDKYRLKAGDTIFLPRKVPHAWTQLSETGSMTVTVQPAGKLENFFVTMAGLTEEPSPDLIAKIFADNEMQVVGPTLRID
ncbi:cupin domain-containing protein [Pontibacter sp. BT310]|uniref:Cupin domain-containing protein n=1 Tax=Pontibacter populi TaxID=890055 RepID=A0ABS6XDF6_9BACT|nr:MULTISPECIES: cupin domain-containing protein [Pontibacter]MBJ6118684.1 cupin domain-containing protein [Pontibacter sp. BT310]MBR0571113.1 cupin domain-containing protein [Microvirga sp. STS03]MBW3365538.1 cupin domain-containing protein [Pontibacter populi]